MSGGGIAPCGCADCRSYDSLAPQRCTKPTIKLRIRVGVTADGQYLAAGSNDPLDAKRDITATLAECIDAVAWHWITAEVPMPDVEQGEVAGEVER